jgi:transposase
VVGVEQWAELRRLYFVTRLSIKEIVRRTGHGRNTIRRALRSVEAPCYRRPMRPSKLDPFRDEVHRLLREEPRLPGKRLRELLEEQGYTGGKTILDDYLREVRPLFLPRPRTFQRTSYRPGALCQFDLWEPSREVAVGSGQTRARLCRRRLPALLARRRGHARVLEAGAGSLVRDRRVPGKAGCATGDAGLGSRGRAARRRRPPDRPVCGVLR